MTLISIMISILIVSLYAHEIKIFSTLHDCSSNGVRGDTGMSTCKDTVRVSSLRKKRQYVYISTRTSTSN